MKEASPWRRALLFLALPPAAALTGAALGLTDIASFGPKAVAEAPWLGAWGSALVERLSAGGFSLALASAILSAALYAGAQAAGLQAEGARRSPVFSALLWLSGRPLHAAADDPVETGDLLLAPLRLGFALFPMFGFLGTVIGLSGAIRDLPAAISDGAKLDPVLQNLFVAFDTTFLGLVGAILCLIAIRLLEGALDRRARDVAA